MSIAPTLRAGRRPASDVLAPEPAEGAGHDRDLAIEAEHLREHSISHLVIFQLFRELCTSGTRHPGTSGTVSSEASGTASHSQQASEPAPPFKI